MKKKILLISSIILGVVALICIVLVIKNGNTKNNETKISKETTSTKQESIIGQNDINNTVATSIETEEKETENTEEKSVKQTQEKIKEETKEEKTQEITKEIKQETKEEVKQEIKQVTQDKKIENTQEKTTSKVTKETTGTVEKKEQPTTTTVPTKNEEKAPEQVVEQEPAKPIEEPKEETKKIDLSKYDYYENSLNGSYKGFIRDDAEISKLKSLIDTAINEFGYTNVKIVQDNSLPKSGLRSFTANKTNVENLVYDSDGFTICYYAVKEYHISSDGTETLFQTRSYIKVK
ncbi:MAG: hypothetical protein E7313_00355 [Clostridiales bacterium]|nr:hypothetical protein [Clostridiales bacterium]